MGKSRTSPLQKTGSSIGVGGSFGGGGSGGRMGVMGGSGNTASFAQANPNGQVVTQLNIISYIMADNTIKIRHFLLMVGLQQ